MREVVDVPPSPHFAYGVGVAKVMQAEVELGRQAPADPSHAAAVPRLSAVNPAQRLAAVKPAIRLS